MTDQRLKITFDENLREIRLAHTLQCKKEFKKSNILFSEILNTCRSTPDVAMYLDFAFQHSGKNFFDQKHFKDALANFEEALRLRKTRKAPEDQLQSSEQAILRTKQLTLSSRE